MAHLAIRLLGRPGIASPDGAAYRLRSRKSWALLAYLLLSEHAPTRSRLASLLFAEADDPLRALRWSLAEIRRSLGPDACVEGDPVVIGLPEGAVVDVAVLSHGTWTEAVEVAGLGDELLDGLVLRGAPAFESWLLSERRRVAAAAEAILHEAALGLMAQGASYRARGFALRAAAMSPLDEDHQALLIRAYRLSGDDAAAVEQYAAWCRVARDELGVEPGPAIESALRERPRSRAVVATEASVEAAIESGAAAIAAGATVTGVASLRSALTLADSGSAVPPRVRVRQVLAEALIHSVGGQDEEGLAHLHEADRLAVACADPVSSAVARAELGYVDFLRARYDRAELWLEDARRLAEGAPAVKAKATMYLGSVQSDRGSYPEAVALLDDAARLARTVGDLRLEAYALSMRGRVDLVRGDLDGAEEHLAGSMELASRGHWVSFLPWPQALQGEIHLARKDIHRAAESLEQAFARACELGDPCWEGMATRGLALVAEATGETDRAFATLRDAQARSHRRTDPYVWLDVHILDALCGLGRRHRHPDTRRWIEAMRDLSSRTGMRELTARAMLHSAALGDGAPGHTDASADAEAAALLAADLDNPQLLTLL